MKILVEVPDTRQQHSCIDCPWDRECHTEHMGAFSCPLANAKEAVVWDNERHFMGDHPVRLYAVKEDK